MCADEGQHKVYSDIKPKNWICRGRFRLVKIVELPKQRVAGGRVQSRARKSEGKFPVYYVQEVKKEKEWLFKSASTCCRDGKDMSKTWRECSECNDIPYYDKHADDSERVENLVMKIKKRDPDDQGQELCILTEEGKTAAAPFMEYM